jgi:thioredoxin-like negative regulator of GroEL
MEAEEVIHKLARACLEMIRMDLAEYHAILATMPCVDRAEREMALRDVLYRELKQ